MMTKLMFAALALFLVSMKSVQSAPEWTGRWAANPLACADDGYDLFISEREFVIWEQSCKISSARQNGSNVHLQLQCSGEGASPSNEFVELHVSDNVIKRTGGYEFEPSVMKRCP